MATAAAPRHNFLVFAPDLTDPQAHDRRLAVRLKHRERIVSSYQANFLKVGGATVTPESLQPGAENKMTGSFLVLEAENIEEVRKFVESDVYYTGNVWDLEKLVITPLMLAVPEKW